MRYVSRDLFDQDLERAGRQHEVERVEYADDRDENDQPEGAGGDDRRDVELVLGRLGNLLVESQRDEQSTDSATHNDGDDPADDENCNRTENAGQLRPERGVERAADCREIHVASPQESD